jgi:hypothetical protein
MVNDDDNFVVDVDVGVAMVTRIYYVVIFEVVVKPEVEMAA